MSIAGWEIAVGVSAGLAVGVLGVAGVQHLVVDDPVEPPTRRRRALGLVEVALAALGIAAVMASWALPVAGIAFAVIALAFISYLAVLRAIDPGRSCGCTPYSTTVSRSSFVPAALLLGAALLALGASWSDVSFSGVGAERAVVFVVSALIGWTVLLWVPAAER